MADNDKVKDRIGSAVRGVTQDRPEHALDPVRDIASAFTQRHRCEQFAFEAIMLIVVLIFGRENLRQVLVSYAVEETELEFTKFGGFPPIELDGRVGKHPLDCRSGLPRANIRAHQNACAGALLICIVR